MIDRRVILDSEILLCCPAMKTVTSANSRESEGHS